MNFIYDIYVNFKTIPYNFFDWDKNDNIIHLKKIPVLKINDNTFKLIYFNKIRINNNILNEIKNKTEIWKEKKKIKYCLLFCSDKSIIAIKFDKYGNSIKKSTLYIDEELEIIEALKKEKETSFNFEILEIKNEQLCTRLQFKKYAFIKNSLKNISYEKLKYIYFECFNKVETKQKMLLNLKKIKYNSIKFNKLYNILKIISIMQK